MAEPAPRACATHGDADGAAPPPPGLFEEALGDRSGPRAWLEYLAARGALEMVGRLPDGAKERLISALARVARVADRRRSDAARAFLRQALGCARFDADGEERVLEAWRHFFRVTVDSVAFGRRVPAATLLEHYQLELCDDFLRAVSARRGGIVLTPHLGDWEAGSAWLPHMGCDPFFAFARPPRNRPLSAYFLRTRLERRIHVLPRRGGMERVRALVRAGAWLGLLPDQRPRRRYVVAPFFGRPARCERAATVLALRLGVPLAIGACYRTARPFRYRTVFRRVLWPEEIAGRSLEEITTMVNAELEGLILAAPEQYYWLHDRYRGAPEA